MRNVDSWRARCGESRTAGSEGGVEKRTRKSNALCSYPTQTRRKGHSMSATQQLFLLGQTFAIPGAIEALSDAEQVAAGFLD